MYEELIRIIVFPHDFRIRSKADAKKFLTEIVPKDSCYTFPDLNNSKMHFVLFRGKDSGMAHIAHERNGKSEFEPDLMRSGKTAIQMVYENRKSVNAKFFKEE